MVRPSCRPAVTHEQRAPPAIHRPRRGGRRRRRVGRCAVDGRPAPTRSGSPARPAWSPRMSDPARVHPVRIRPRARVPHRHGHPHPRQGRRPSPGRPPPTPRVNRPIIASASPRHGSASATPLLRAALSARLERLRAKYGIPGISASILFADGSDLARRRRSRRRGRQAKGDRRHGLPRGERLEDVHRGADPRPRRGRSRSTSTRRFARTCRRWASPGRSRFASSSTTRAGCATSTSTRASTRRCSPSRPASGMRLVR